MNENIIFALNTFAYIAISIALVWVTSQAFKTLLKIAITKNKNPRNIIKQFFRKHINPPFVKYIISSNINI